MKKEYRETILHTSLYFNVFFFSSNLALRGIYKICRITFLFYRRLFTILHLSSPTLTFA